MKHYKTRPALLNPCCGCYCDCMNVVKRSNQIQMCDDCKNDIHIHKCKKTLQNLLKE